METMHPAGRRTLPPVPRASSERPAVGPGATSAEEPSDSPTERFVVDLTTREQRAVGADEADTARHVVVPDGTAPDDGPEATGARNHAGRPAVPQDVRAPETSGLDAGQQFVARLRAAAADFAAAAGAQSAVVREAVPPARHRRARCRVVLHYADAAQIDVTFLGPTGRPGAPSRHGFDRQIRRWLTAGQRREDAWLVPDTDAPDGLAIDLTAWVAAA
jgi:hypothetical protein